ncbi:methyltransferase family protein [Candidatus Neomarinimicrobiota bacterium]
MSTAPPHYSAAAAKPDQSRLTRSAILRFILFLLLVPAALLLTAGRADWFMGWVYIGLVMVFSAGSRFIVLRKDPDLLAERAQSLSKEDAKPWDKWIVLQIAMVGPIAMLVVCGLDERFGWSPDMPPGYQLAALGIIVLGYFLGTWAMMVNRFFSAVVRIQKDRGHQVVSGGPYRLMRHPSYIGGILSDLTIPFLLGSFWALIPGVYLAALMILRTALEDRTLREELEGYEEYTRKVRFRLVPGIW